MDEVQTKSVFIEGDKSYFSSKAAIDRFKKDLKNDNNEKLLTNDYFKEGWTYQLLEKTDTEIKVKILNKLDLPINNTPAKPRVIEVSEKRQLLKNRLNEMKGLRTNQSSLKSKLKDVPDDVADAYLQLKKVKLPVSIHDPAKVFAKKDEYKNEIYTLIHSFGAYKGVNNPVINYYKLLAKHLDIPLPQLPPHKHDENCKHFEPSTTDFLEQLKDQKMKNEVEKEMNSIYESIGLNKNEEEEDEEMTSILNKLKQSNVLN